MELNDQLKQMLMDETDRILKTQSKDMSKVERILFSISLQAISDVVRPLPLNVSTRVLTACLAISEMLEGVSKDTK